MKKSKRFKWTGVMVGLTASQVQAGLLAYEPFTNAPGTAIIGSADGFGFAGSWQNNSSSGLATNMMLGLSYTDENGAELATAGGAGFFRGSTSSSSAIQPIRLFDFSRGTNGTDNTTTWISFLIVRQGPTGTLAGNPYGRGANVPHDLNTGNIQKLAIGNSSGASVNTVGLIPEGSSSNLKSSTDPFGGVTNFVVVRIDHVNGANDDAYLFVNPVLETEPLPGTAGAVSLGEFDYSFDRLRVFAGGQSSAQQPYAELILDEYRIGETFADVAPIAPAAEPPPNPLVFTNLAVLADEIILSGVGGSNGVTYHLLSSVTLEIPGADWPAIATNDFDAEGNFSVTTPLLPGPGSQFFRLRVPPPPVPMIPPSITTEPNDMVVTEGNAAAFAVGTEGSAPLHYQWYFYPDTTLTGATNATYTIASAQTNQTGDYFVVVTNDYGAVTSALATLTVDLAPILLPGAYFVATDGNDSNSGSEESPFLTISKALNTITTRGTIYVREGTYAMSSRLSLSRTGDSYGAIKLWAYPGEMPVIDSTGNSSDGIRISGDNYHLKGLTIINAGHNGINISGDSNIIEFCTVRANGNTGLHITGGSSGTTYPSYNLILNCDSYLNYDPENAGENADGFTAKWDLGPGNTFSGCRAWWNSDDGWDLWMANSPVLITNCWAFWNGIDHWNTPGFSGDGNGIKLGGNYVGAPHHTVRCASFENQATGFDQNNNLLGQTMDNNTAWSNKSRNFSMAHGVNTTPHIARNNLSALGGSSDSWTSGTLFTNNSWNVLSPAPSAADVLSVDSSLVAGPRQADGSLPDILFLHPEPAGRLIDKGVILSDPYSGTAPDLGAFEDGL